MNAKGWAVIMNGEIDVKSVSPTRRAALVNWLHTHGRPITNAMQDASIEAVWTQAVRVTSRLGVVEVEICEAIK